MEAKHGEGRGFCPGTPPLGEEAEISPEKYQMKIVVDGNEIVEMAAQVLYLQCKSHAFVSILRLPGKMPVFLALFC